MYTPTGKSRRTVLSWLLFLSLALASLPMFGQSTTGSIVGTVVDPSGAVVPNAAVTVTNQNQMGVTRELKTDHNGSFTAPSLPVGTYSVAASAPGFDTTTQKDVVLNVQDKRALKIALTTGRVETSVSVEANALTVDTQNAAAGGTINSVQIRGLALQSRNYAELAALQPGVTTDIGDSLYVGVSAPGGATNEVAFSLNGSMGTQNSWTIDGADNVDRGGNFTLLNYPSVDAIEEFKILRGNYDAEYGRGAGGQVNVITRSGTSTFHGGVYEFFRNDVLDANTWSNKQADPIVPRQPLRYNDFGGTIGGPIFIPNHYNTQKNKTFFFFSEEVRRVVESSSVLALAPNALERGQSGDGSAQFNVPVCLDPACATFGTSIPANMINPAAAGYLTDVYSHVPLPQDPTTDLLFSNQANVFNYHQEIFRLDQAFSQKWTAFFRYMNDSIPTIEGGGLFNENPIPNISQTTTNSPGRNFAVSITGVLSPSVVNQFEYAWSYGAVLSTNTGQLASAASPNVGNTIVLPYPVTLGRIPSINFGQSLGSFNGFGNYNDYNRNNSFLDNLTKVKGKHELKFGVAYNIYQKQENSGGNNAGTYLFQATNFAPGVDGSDGRNEWSQEWANFLLGNSSNFQQLSQDIQAVTRQHQLELYAQDTYRVRANLTLSYGLRYSLFYQPYDAKGHNSSFYPQNFQPGQAPAIDASGNICVPNVQCDESAGPVIPNPNYNPLNGMIIGGKNSPWGGAVSPTTYNAFAPRIGIAWDPWSDGKTSVRAGYGIFYDSPGVGYVENNVFINPPFVQSALIFGAPFNQPSAGESAPPTPGEIGGVGAGWHQPYNQQWDFDIQHQLPKDFLFDIGYYGSKGTHILAAVDVNQPFPGSYASNPILLNNPNYGGGFLTSDNDALINAIRPYPGYGPIGLYEPWFYSNYNSLQMSLQKRWGDAILDGNFTWSKNLTDVPFDPIYTFPQNSYDLRAEYGPSRFNRKFVFNMNLVYPLPFFRQQKGFVGHLLGGWEYSAIIAFNSGQYQTVTTASSNDPAGLGLFTSSAVSYQPRPDQIGDANNSAPHTAAQWFNTSAFVDVPDGQFRPGNAPRASILGPGFQEWNMSLMKNMKIYERTTLQFRAEAFNVFNHTNYGSIDTTLGDSTFGQVTGAHQPRILQLGLKLNF